MFKKLIEKVGTILTKAPSPSSMNQKIIAHQKMKDVIKELSQGKVGPSFNLSPELLKHIENKIDSSSTKSIPSDVTPSQLDDLGISYFLGNNGFKQDTNKAIKYWHQAADLGSKDAKFRLANCLKDGVGMPANPFEAFNQFEELAKMDYPMANYTLGLMYEKGIGTEQSYPKFFQQMEIAASKGFHPAMYNLGNAYYSGLGVLPSLHNAIKYYTEACNGGDFKAHFTLASLYAAGKIEENPKTGKIEKNLTGKLTENTYKKIFYHTNEAAKGGHPAAMYNLGMSYLLGDQIVKEKNEDQAIQWLELASKRGVAEAALNLSKYYMENSLDFQKAEDVLLPLLQRQHPIAIELLKLIRERRDQGDWTLQKEIEIQNKELEAQQAAEAAAAAAAAATLSATESAADAVTTVSTTTTNSSTTTSDLDENEEKTSNNESTKINN